MICKKELHDTALRGRLTRPLKTIIEAVEEVEELVSSASHVTGKRPFLEHEYLFLQMKCVTYPILLLVWDLVCRFHLQMWVFYS